jgi:hypothetical protein
MTDIGKLISAKQAADTKLAAAESDLLTELVAAKDAHRAAPAAQTRARKTKAVAAVVAYRAAVRADRDRHAVAGDAFLSPEQNEG